MRKILLIIILSSLIMGCRTKHKSVLFTKEGKTEIEHVNFDSVKEKNLKQETKKITDNIIQKKKEDFSGDVIIKGKSDSLNPLEFHNIVNGDTLQSISIKGKADYVINNRYSKAEQSKAEVGKEETLNVIQETARDLVSKKTIKEVASTVETKAKEIKEKGFTFGSWGSIIVFGVVALAFVFLYLWFRKSAWFKDRFNN